MKKSFGVLTVLALLAFVLPSLSYGEDEWVNIGLSDPDLNSASIRALAINPNAPNILYVGGSIGIYKSTDGGITWTNPTRSVVPRTLAIDPQTTNIIYAGGGTVLMKTTDGGDTWFYPCDFTRLINIIAIDPQTPSNLYMGTQWGGLYKSTDGGTTWNLLLYPWFSCGQGAWLTIAIDPETPNTLYAGSTDCGVYKSIDGGTTWIPTNSGLPDIEPGVYALRILPQTPSTIYLGNSRLSTPSYGVHKSTDSGATWNATGLTGLSITSVVIDPQTPSTIYAAAHGVGVFRSTDGGVTWNAMSSGLTNTYIWVLAIDPQNPSILYAGTEKGVFKIQQMTCPTTNAGRDITIECDKQCNTVIQGTASESGNDTLTYRWLEGEIELIPWQPVGENGECPLDLSRIPALALGSHPFTLEVSDGKCTSTDEMILTVTGNTVMAAVAGDPAGGSVSPSSQTVSCGATATFTVTTNIGYTATVSEGTLSGNTWTIPNVTSSHTVTVTMIDNTPPSITDVSVNPNLLWPPNHKMVDVTVNYNATDNSGQTACQISSVTSNEPISGSDYSIVNAHHVQLRAERLGSDYGRIYTITIICTDASGNPSSQSVLVTVPHDQGK